MAGGRNMEIINKVTFSLLLFSMLDVVLIEGATGPCSVKLENIAVYEGDVYTVSYSAGAISVKWTAIPTTDELSLVTIVDSNSQVMPTYASDFGVNDTGLEFKNATTLAGPGHELSTAGLYTAECGGSEMSFKFLVVRHGPTCSCKKGGSLRVQLTCSTVYADSTYDPIAAIHTLLVDGKPTDSDSPQRSSFDGYTWISTSTFTVVYSSSSTYQCRLTFGTPTEVQDPNVAMNAPKFNQNCSFPATACDPTIPASKTTATKKPSPKTTVPQKAATQPPQKTANPDVLYSALDLKTTALIRYTKLMSAPAETTTPAIATRCNNCGLSNCPPSIANCKRSSECQSDETESTAIYSEAVVKATMCAKVDPCCLDNVLCGVVVTLKDDSRWLIHDDPLRNANSCKMTVVDASCMSSDWIYYPAKMVSESTVGDYVKAGNTGPSGQSAASCLQSCTRMINLL